MGFLGDFFSNSNSKNNSFFETTTERENLKNQLTLRLMQYGFTRMEINEVLDVITLAEADIKVAKDSLNHVNLNNQDPTRSIHSALNDIKLYQKELAFNLRKKILDIIERKKTMHHL